MIKRTAWYFVIFIFCGILSFGSFFAKGFNAAAQSDGSGQNMSAKPTVIEVVVSKTQYEELKTQSQCDVALFYVKEDLKIDLNGELTVDNVMQYIMSKPAGASFVPLFIAIDGKAGAALAQRLNTLGNANCIMGSADKEVLGNMRESAPQVSGLLDLRDSPKMSVDKVRDEVTEAKSKIALIKHQMYSADEIFRMQKLLLCIWSEAQKDNVSIGGAIVSGANGVLAANGGAVNSIISKLLPTSMLKRNIIIGHRGIPLLLPDNTLEGAKLAAQNGADIIESDIFLSADNRLVISHDNDLSINTNGEGLITTKTLEQIEQYKIKQGNREFSIPTLDEYFDEFKDSDIVHFVEIKDSNTAIIETLKQLIDSKGVWDQVVIISFHKTQLEKAAEVMPNITRGNLNTVADIESTLNLHSAVLQTLNELVPLASTYNASRVSVDAQFARKLSHYGITCWPWTYANEVELKREYTYGYGGLTTDAAQAVSEFAVLLSVPAEIVLDKGQAALDLAVISRTGSNIETNNAFLLPLTEDAISLSLQNGTLNAAKSGEGWYIAGATFTYDTVTYTLYSQPFKVITTSGAGGCGCNGQLSLFYVLPVLAAISAIVLFKRKDIK